MTSNAFEIERSQFYNYYFISIVTERVYFLLVFNMLQEGEDRPMDLEKNTDS